MGKLLFIALTLLLAISLTTSSVVKKGKKGEKPTPKKPRTTTTTEKPGLELDDKYDGVGIGLIERPKICKKRSRRGDLVRVTFNVSIGEAHGKAWDDRYEKTPLEFILGDGEMVGGFDVGLTDMCVGEVRHLTVPHKYAYKDGTLGKLPARTTLYFFVKMQSIKTPKKKKDVEKPNQFRMMDINYDQVLSHDEVKAYLEKTGHKDVAGDSGIRQMLREIWREEDRNGNGYIDKDEFSGEKMDIVRFEEEL